MQKWKDNHTYKFDATKNERCLGSSTSVWCVQITASVLLQGHYAALVQLRAIHYNRTAIFAMIRFMFESLNLLQIDKVHNIYDQV